MPATADVPTLIEDIKEMGSLLCQQQAQKRPITDIMQTHASRFGDRTNVMSVSAVQANDLLNAFEGGPFTQDQKDAFSAKLADRIGAVFSPSRSLGSPCAQKIHIEFYTPDVFINKILPDQSTDINVKI